MIDFALDLPSGVGVEHIAIVPETSTPALIQRAVCLMIAHEDKGLYVNEIPVLDLFNRMTTKDIIYIAQLLSPVADRLKELLNEDIRTVSDISFTVEQISNKIQVNINIIPIDVTDVLTSTISFM